MVEVNVHNDIASEKDGQWMAMWGLENAVFSLDTVKRIFESNKEETEFLFNYHCDGGSVSEGFAIYDYIRTSGKTIHSNIEGNCHSMAVTLMLAAEKGNRRSNPNASALIHEIRGGVSGTAEEVREMADYMDQQTEKMLNIYEDRTGTDRETLKSLIKEEKMRTADELLQYGFISKINPYTTNANNKKEMAKTIQEIKDLQNKSEGLLAKLKNLLTPKTDSPKTYDVLDTEGAILFTVNREDEAFAVGDVASPDGVYNFEDGRVVTVAEGVVASIEVKEEAVEDLTDQLAERDARIAELENSLTEAQTLIAEQNEVITSNYTPKPRLAVKNTAGKGGKKLEDAASLKAEALEKRKIFKSK